MKLFIIFIIELTKQLLLGNKVTNQEKRYNNFLKWALFRNGLNSIKLENLLSKNSDKWNLNQNIFEEFTEFDEIKSTTQIEKVQEDKWHILKNDLIGKFSKPNINKNSRGKNRKKKSFINDFESEIEISHSNSQIDNLLKQILVKI